MQLVIWHGVALARKNITNVVLAITLAGVLTIRHALTSNGSRSPAWVLCSRMRLRGACVSSRRARLWDVSIYLVIMHGVALARRNGTNAEPQDLLAGAPMIRHALTNSARRYPAWVLYTQ